MHGLPRFHEKLVVAALSPRNTAGIDDKHERDHLLPEQPEDASDGRAA